MSTVYQQINQSIQQQFVTIPHLLSELECKQLVQLCKQFSSNNHCIVKWKNASLCQLLYEKLHFNFPYSITFDSDVLLCHCKNASQFSSILSLFAQNQLVLILFLHDTSNQIQFSNRLSTFENFKPFALDQTISVNQSKQIVFHSKQGFTVVFTNQGTISFSCEEDQYFLLKIVTPTQSMQTITKEDIVQQKEEINEENKSVEEWKQCSFPLSKNQLLQLRNSETTMEKELFMIEAKQKCLECLSILQQHYFLQYVAFPAMKLDLQNDFLKTYLSEHLQYTVSQLQLLFVIKEWKKNKTNSTICLSIPNSYYWSVMQHEEMKYNESNQMECFELFHHRCKEWISKQRKLIPRFGLTMEQIQTHGKLLRQLERKEEQKILKLYSVNCITLSVRDKKEVVSPTLAEF